MKYRVAVEMDCVFTTEMEVDARSTKAARDQAFEAVVADGGWGSDKPLLWQRSGALTEADVVLAVRKDSDPNKLQVPVPRVHVLSRRGECCASTHVNSVHRTMASAEAVVQEFLRNFDADNGVPAASWKREVSASGQVVEWSYDDELILIESPELEG